MSEYEKIKWEPMDFAPKDGEIILLDCSSPGRCAVGCWDESKSMWMLYNQQFQKTPYVSWMSGRLVKRWAMLPAPPTTDEGEGK